jgi:arylsulfatase A-like enzyme
MSYSVLNFQNRTVQYAISLAVGALLLAVILLFNTGFKEVTSQSKPNVIVILLDDAGYADFGFMGSKDLQTPNIDQLANRAVVFKDAHVSASVCSPSRAGLLTGKYQQRFGYECNEGEGYTGMDTTQRLIPQLLLDKGYTTAAFGKWHLGFAANQHPLKKGFQYYYGFLSGGRSYFYQPNKDDKAGSKNALQENGQPVSFDGYLTDVLGDKAVDYIKQNNRNPFFMYWAPNAVHTPMEAAEADMKLFANHPRQKLAAMTFALDRAVGKMVAELKRQNIFDNTIIIFLSDNGGAHNNQSSNLPLKGFKGNKYEGGHRIPFFISWPKVVKQKKAFNGLASSLDILPTVLDAAGAATKHKKHQTDGVSLIPYISGKKNGSPHQELVWRKDAAMAIRYKQYKLIHVKQLEDRLYDLGKDPGETVDVKAQKPELYRMMKQKLTDWQKDKMKPIWTEGAVWDTITLMIHDDLMNNRKVRVRNPEELQNLKKKK